MENPFIKLVSEEEPVVENDKRQQLEEAQKQLAALNEWQNNWTNDDVELAERLKKEIEELKSELGE